MARLKRDHSGYHSYGLYAKYKQPSISEKPNGNRLKKKNTNKWCRGKIGTEHKWHSYQQKRWSDERWAFMNTYIEIKCVECRKEKYIKTARAAIYPFHIWIDHQNEGYQSIQVKVNGKILPIAEYQYHKDRYWCKECGTWHKS